MKRNENIDLTLKLVKLTKTFNLRHIYWEDIVSRLNVLGGFIRHYKEIHAKWEDFVSSLNLLGGL